MNPVIEDQPAEHEPAMPTVPTLTKAQAQALIDAYDIDVDSLLLDQVKLQLSDNPEDLLGAYTVLELIAKHGKP
jgi:hypothetical protein